MTRSFSGSRPEGRRSGVDVYLFPAVVGGGLGDIAEVLDAGRWLERAGFLPRLYRARGHPLPPSVDGPWDWPPRLRVVDELRPSAPRALTVAPVWGVSAAPERPGAYGRPGPWAQEAAEIESAYGADRTVHVSLEEFARTYTSRRENLERYREGGVAGTVARTATRGESGRGPREEWVRAFRRFRALDRPNVVHLLSTFETSSAFRREFPEIVQVGPLWPHVYSGRTGRTGRPDSVLWYASPASSATILDEVCEGLADAGSTVNLAVRSSRPLSTPPRPGVNVSLHSAFPSRLWRPRFGSARLRIVTGSRSLLEALELGGPFLYFNGVLTVRGHRRRHRPEKAAGLVRLFQRLHVPAEVRRDLDAFSRGLRVAEVVRRAYSEYGWRRSFPAPAEVRRGCPRGAGEVLVALAREWARGRTDSGTLVARLRRGSPSSPRPRGSKV